MKMCAKCKIDKELSAFGITKRYNKAGEKVSMRYSYCKPCRVTLNRADARAHPERVRRLSRKSKLKLNYDISPEDHIVQLQAQKFCCAICSTTLEDKSPQTIHVDHNHKSGKLRGILCGACNTGIGMLKESEEIMVAALAYIRHDGVWDFTGINA